MDMLTPNKRPRLGYNNKWNHSPDSYDTPIDQGIQQVVQGINVQQQDDQDDQDTRQLNNPDLLITPIQESDDESDDESYTGFSPCSGFLSSSEPSPNGSSEPSPNGSSVLSSNESNQELYVTGPFLVIYPSSAEQSPDDKSSECSPQTPICDLFEAGDTFAKTNLSAVLFDAENLEGDFDAE